MTPVVNQEWLWKETDDTLAEIFKHGEPPNSAHLRNCLFHSLQYTWRETLNNAITAIAEWEGRTMSLQTCSCGKCQTPRRTLTATRNSSVS
jgi:hypothetical protein